MTHEHLEKGSVDRNVDGGLHIQLEKDGGGSTNTELDGLEWSVASAALGVTRHKSVKAQ